MSYPRRAVREMGVIELAHEDAVPQRAKADRLLREALNNRVVPTEYVEPDDNNTTVVFIQASEATEQGAS